MCISGVIWASPFLLEGKGTQEQHCLCRISIARVNRAHATYFGMVKGWKKISIISLLCYMKMDR